MTMTGAANRSALIPGAAPLRIDVEVCGGSASVRPHGELDLASAAQLSGVVFSVLDIESVWRVEIDAVGLDFVDVAGLVSLVDASHACTARGVQCRVTRRSPSLRRLLDLVAIGQRFADPALN